MDELSAVRQFLATVASRTSLSTTEDSLLALATGSALPVWQRVGWLTASLVRHARSHSVSRLMKGTYGALLAWEGADLVGFRSGPNPADLPWLPNQGTSVAVSPVEDPFSSIYIEVSGRPCGTIHNASKNLRSWLGSGEIVIEIGAMQTFLIEEQRIWLGWKSRFGYPVYVSASSALPRFSTKYLRHRLSLLGLLSKNRYAKRDG